jgi:hypothetical protein
MRQNVIVFFTVIAIPKENLLDGNPKKMYADDFTSKRVIKVCLLQPYPVDLIIKPLFFPSYHRSRCYKFLNI